MSHGYSLSHQAHTSISPQDTYSDHEQLSGLQFDEVAKVYSAWFTLILPLYYIYFTIMKPW
jgi:hypothetical protein